MGKYFLSVDSPFPVFPQKHQNRSKNRIRTDKTFFWPHVWRLSIKHQKLSLEVFWENYVLVMTYHPLLGPKTANLIDFLDCTALRRKLKDTHTSKHSAKRKGKILKKNIDFILQFFNIYKTEIIGTPKHMKSGTWSRTREICIKNRFFYIMFKRFCLAITLYHKWPRDVIAALSVSKLASRFHMCCPSCLASKAMHWNQQVMLCHGTSNKARQRAIYRKCEQIYKYLFIFLTIIHLQTFCIAR